MSATTARYTESLGKHDHGRCVTRALAAAEKICGERKLRLTPLRRRVLELVWARHAPVGAYDILGSLKKGEGALEPPTVYRALKFLQEAGLVHRIDSLNAFIGCESPQEGHAAQFLVCRKCQRVTELDDPSISEMLVEKARMLGFATDAQDIEIKGLCATCRE
ncbi:MAG: transcriptional repressor [Pseudomonadota bacterium]|jgi:Fur family zinc uptake transcriptional regulator